MFLHEIITIIRNYYLLHEICSYILHKISTYIFYIFKYGMFCYHVLAIYLTVL